MEPEIIFESFDASTVELSSSNLIEASAGTGKTFSIGILVLRLIMENEIPIKEILMVTFTKAAVAELEERIRLFVRTAYEISKEEKVPENKSIIYELVNNAIHKTSRVEIVKLLKVAVIYLDETSVLTIHSFCQQTLNEFAFETHQLFGAEILQDTSAIIENEVNKFWRKHITSVPEDLLLDFGDQFLRKDIQKIVKEHLAGKNYHEFKEGTPYALNKVCYDEIREKKIETTERIGLLEIDLHEYILQTQEHLKQQCSKKPTAVTHVLPLINEPEAFIKYIVKSNAKYIEDLFGDYLIRIAEYEAAVKKYNIILKSSCNPLHYAAISFTIKGIKEHKLLNNQLSFDDLITNLHSALVLKENPILITALQNKYKAVFIDEFQDTDRLQYEIFNKAFGGIKTKTVLFYIGDPKQSIYAWRTADISVYFSAYKDVAKKYEMAENHRSCAAYISAMNFFFKPVDTFDTFAYNQVVPSIKYIHVKSPAINKNGKLNFNNSPCIPITINTQTDKKTLKDAVICQVIDLLSYPKYSITEKGETRPIKPSDIGILVRKNKEGKAIKKALSKYKIPAITIGDEKVLGCEEATDILYILEAMVDISRQNINRALLCSFTGYTTMQILQLNNETITELFKKYKTDWDFNGVYDALINFVADFNVKDVLLHNNTENGERIITNLYQLIELLYKVQTTKKLNAEELISWLKRGIESNDAQGDEYEQKIENDEEAIKIVSIHKSKGLEYNIVLAPFLDLTEWKAEPFCCYKKESGNYINSKKNQLSDEDLIPYREQCEQENRRLVYVAITRAVYKCFIFKNTDPYFNNSTITSFIQAFQVADETLAATLIEFNNGQTGNSINYTYQKEETAALISDKTPKDFTLTHNNWQRMSYTMLAAETEKISKSATGIFANAYDEFIFKQLSKGSKTGNMLHDILENINFSTNEHWPLHIDNAIKRFNPALRNNSEPKLVEMLQQILEADITIGKTSFRLDQVGFNDRIHEFEFDFPVTPFNTLSLKNIANDNLNINVKDRKEIEGIMNGKIDMLFQCQEKYFVLDWKSTFLGDALSAYSPELLVEAMSENNYHLQYLIYTLATKKYLETRLTNFDYEKDFGGVLYLFVRGMRKGTDSGIFNCKPTLDQIQQLEAIFFKQELA